MREDEAIKFLETLEVGTFLTVNIPISSNQNMPVTAMYAGKDKDGRYNFFDGVGACGTFKMNKNFIIQRDIKITNKLDEEKSYDLYVELKKYQNKLKDKHKARDSR